MGQRTDDLSTLIPIKGISNAMKKKLASDCGIHDISGLLLNGRTVAARADIAARLQTKSQYVTNWVKQADLWRVPSMTTDLAFVLTLVSVRCTYDLAKVDTHNRLSTRSSRSIQTSTTLVMTSYSASSSRPSASSLPPRGRHGCP